MKFPGLLVLGATGRIGRILRHVWPRTPDLAPLAAVTKWQARHPDPDIDPALVFDPLHDADALQRAASEARVLLCLAGSIPGRLRPGDTLEDNVHLARATLAAAPAGARVLLCSSAAVYGQQEGALSETHPCAPVNDYGRAKVAMEAMARAQTPRPGVRVTNLRIGNIAGIDSVLGGWKPGFQLDIFADGHSPRRSYIGVETLARVLGQLCSHPDPLPAVLNVAAPGGTEMATLLDAAGKLWHPRPAPEAAIPAVTLDVRRLQELVPLPQQASDVAGMIREWHMLEPHLKQEEARN
jgi:nucleoside-diphosphate-sugar epimerase